MSIPANTFQKNTEFHLTIAKALSRTLDNRFSFGGVSFGLDTLLGFLPVGGDVLAFVFSLYILWIGYQLRVPRKIFIQMLFNSLLDLAIGTIPLIGDVADLIFKSNIKNVELLQKHVAQQKRNASVVLEGEVLE